MLKPMEARRSELYQHVAAQATDTALSLNMPAERAEHLGAAIADALAEVFGGQVLSFPKNAAFKLSKRERAILEAHRQGATYSELMREYDMTERGLRKLLARALKRERNLNQMGLFGEDAG